MNTYTECPTTLEMHNGYEMIIHREYCTAKRGNSAKIVKVECAICRRMYDTKPHCLRHCIKFHSQPDNANELIYDSSSEPEHNAAEDEQQQKLADEVEADHLRQIEAEAEEERQRILAAELEAEYQRKLSDAAKQRQIALELAEQKRLAEEAERQRIAAEEAEHQRQLAEIDDEYQLKMSIRQQVIAAEAERKRAEEIAIQTQYAAAKAEQEKIAIRNRLTDIAAEREELYNILVVEQRKTDGYFIKAEYKQQLCDNIRTIRNRYNELEKEAQRLQDELIYDQKEITRRNLEKMSAQKQMLQKTHKMFFGGGMQFKY